MTTIPLESPTDYQQTAQSMLKQIREIVEKTPDFKHLPSDKLRKINPSASLSDEFLQSVALACDVHANLAASSQINSAELRDAINFATAFRPVARQLELLARGVSDTIATRRATVGERALHAYNIAQRLSRSGDVKTWIEHINNMKRTVRRGRRRSAAPAAEVVTAPKA